jgi:hypothetical protein
MLWDYLNEIKLNVTYVDNNNRFIIIANSILTWFNIKF